MAFGYIYACLTSGFLGLAAASTVAVDATGRHLEATVATASGSLPESAGMLRRESATHTESPVHNNPPPASFFEARAEEESDNNEWNASADHMDHVPMSTYFNFAEYGQRYMEARDRNKQTGMRRKTPANALQEPDKKELRFFVRSLLEEVEDFEKHEMFSAKKGTSRSRGVQNGEHIKEAHNGSESPSEVKKKKPKDKEEAQKGKDTPASLTENGQVSSEENLPDWYNGGKDIQSSALKFEYQSVVGRDGFEPDPTEPLCEYFGPFKIDYGAHTIFLNNWNFVLGTKVKKYGYGNLIVGNNQSYSDARNGVITGKSNILRGSYGAVSGENNYAAGRGAVADGGYMNEVLSSYGNVNGGMKNNVTTHFAVASGGLGNTAQAPFSTVGGGSWNWADGFSSSVMGGGRNFAMANVSEITGGFLNNIPDVDVSDTILGGHKGNVPVPEEPPPLLIKPAEKNEKSEASREVDMSKLAAQDAQDNGDKGYDSDVEEMADEMEEQEEKERNAATMGETVDLSSGYSRRRSPHSSATGDDLEVISAPEQESTLSSKAQRRGV